MKTPLEAFQEFYDVVKEDKDFDSREYNECKIFSWRNSRTGAYRVFEISFNTDTGNISWADIELPYG